MNLRALGTPAVVTLIAVLVWSLAESQTLQRGSVQVDVALAAGGGARVLRVAPSERWSARVELEVQGPAAALNRVTTSATGPVTLRLGIELPDAVGDVRVDLREAISRSDFVRNSGLRVVRVDPPTVLMQVDVLERLTRPVSVALDAGEADSPPVPTPAEVTVYVPASLVARLPDSVIARVPAATASGLRPGETAEVPGVPIVLDNIGQGMWGVRTDPSQVSARVTLRRRTAETTLPDVPLEVALPPGQVGLWRIEVPAESRVLRGIRVSGPSAAVGRLASGPSPVRAIVRLGESELAVGAARRPVVLVGLPSGVGPLEESITVEVRIERAGE